jgi:osmotically inducible lipoprotein OsmB
MLSPKQFALCVTTSALLLSMTACGHDPGDRALSGAGIGAGAGLGAALLGAPLLPALVIGGAVGAATGAATSDKQINLGK